jgi:hypothetical protein
MSRAVPGARTLRAQPFLGVLLMTAAATGCIKGEVGIAGPPDISHPDLNCNTAPDALANAECRLQLGVAKTEYIQQPGDKDWWVVNVGALPPRAIVHVVAGYRLGPGTDGGAANTAVNFQINVLDSNNGAPGTSLATGVDQHGSNAPTMLDLTFRYTKGNNDLFLLVQDQSGRQYDNLSPYSILVEVITDPDANEPNDTPATATPITLTGSASSMQGSNGGYLATPGDVDYYSIVAANPNSVMWLDVVQDCTTATCPPPHRYRLEYFLRDPNGTVVATDSSTAGSLVSSSNMEVATARLLKTTGTYTLQVRGWIDPNNQVVIPPGDLKFKYKVQVIIVPLQDNVEIAGNNTIDDAKANPAALTLLPVGGSATITGRISFVPDPDYYILRLAGDPSGRPHLLHYKVTPSTAPARFPALPGPRDRLLQVTTEIPAGAQSACAAGDAGVCIISADPSNYNYPIATNLCLASTPQCLQSTRYENPDAGSNPNLVKLGNFESILQVPPHTGSVDYYFLYEDDGTNWADDTDYTIFVEWLNEPDPAEAVPDPQRGPVAMGTGPAATPLSGFLSYGIGALDTSLGISPITDVKDYDGRGDDVDTYEVDVPVGAVPADTRLFFQWRIPAAAMTTTPPYDLGIRLGFCVPDAGPPASDCATIQTRTQSGGSQLGLIYTPDPVTSWWNFSPQATPNEPAYDRTYDAAHVPPGVLTAFRDYACGCLEQRLVGSAGSARMFISVFPINRTGWLTTYNLPYTVETGFGAVPSYPYNFTAVPSGKSIACPTPCQFTKN